MSDMKLGTGWLGTIFFLIFIALGMSFLNTSMIFSEDSNTLKESTNYTDSRMAEQKIYVDRRTLDLREEYLGIARQQSTTNRYLIFLTCTTKKTATECKKEQEALDQLQQETQLNQ